MQKLITRVNLYLIYSLIFLFSCAERDRKNPLDPGTNIVSPISLQVVSHDQRVDLSWNQPDMTDYNGFYVYRRDHPDSNYKQIALTLPIRFHYSDYDVAYGVEYSYYVTILGNGTESSPSSSVSVIPGPGYNWIVDKWGYQVIKTTYDCRHYLFSYYTDWLPADMAIDQQNNVAAITQPSGNKIVMINSISGDILASFTSYNREFIDHPYIVKYEPVYKYFWVADSGGSLYRISATTYSIENIETAMKKPVDISMDPQNEVFNVLDEQNKNIWQFQYDGTFLGIINYIGDHQLNNPKKYVVDSVDNQCWLIDRDAGQDFIYKGNYQTQQMTLVDSVEDARDLEINPVDHSVWIISYKSGNSTILQLSKDGDRQLELSGYSNPYDLTINPYDGTLLIADTGNYRVVHLSPGLETYGAYSQLNFPIRVVVE